MQITRKTDYAIRCVAYLAGRPGRVVVIDEIAAEALVPRNFLAKILQRLKAVGLVRSKRGLKGGFELARKPGAISLYDVILATEGPVVINNCALRRGACGLSPSCKVHPVWTEIRAATEKILRARTFDRMA